VIPSVLAAGSLLEALAIAARATTAGSADAVDDETLRGVRALAAGLRLSWASRKHRGFFLRAEDFFGFTKTIARMRTESLARLDEIGREVIARHRLDRRSRHDRADRYALAVSGA